MKTSFSKPFYPEIDQRTVSCFVTYNITTAETHGAKRLSIFFLRANDVSKRDGVINQFGWLNLVTEGWT